MITACSIVVSICIANAGRDGFQLPLLDRREHH